MPRAVFPLLLAVALSLITGCAREVTLDASTLLSAESQPAGELTAERIQTTSPARLVFKIVSGDNAGERWVMEVLRHEQDALRITIGPEDSDEPVSEEIRVPVRGGWGLRESINRDDDAHTTFDPPLLVAPERLTAGESVESTSKMVVRSLEDTSRIKEQGEVTQTLTYDADQTVSAGPGDVAAARLRAEFNASLGAARVERVTDRWFAPEGEGWLIAVRYRESVKALGGIYDRRRAQVMALVEQR